MTTEAKQIEMFGCTETALDRAIEAAIGSPFLVPMSILSDAQELIERDKKNEARQLINRAKYLMMKLYGRDLEKTLRACELVLNVTPNQDARGPSNKLNGLEAFGHRTTYDLAAALGALPLMKSLKS